MAVKKFRPTTPSRRQMTMPTFEEITTNSTGKITSCCFKENGGRNAQGKITVRHHGGGAKRKYRIIDFKRNKDGIPAKVATIEYDPNRTAYIALSCICRWRKEIYTCSSRIKSWRYSSIRSRCRYQRTPLKNIPVGTVIHNIELQTGKGGQIVRSAGNFSTING